MASQPSYDIFISYADADRAWVEGYLLDALVQAGLRCHSEAAFALGVPRLIEFERAIKGSRRTLLILSPAYLANEFNQFVDLLAQSYGLETATWPVIPLILQPVELPMRLAMLTAIEAIDPATRQKSVEYLCAEFQRTTPHPPPIPECPYPGMVPFTEVDANKFFGRERKIDEVLRILRHQNYLFVIGPSGSGKTSLLLAGLVPELHRRYPSEWMVKMMRPGQTPLATLTQTIGGAPQADTEYAARVAATLTQTPTAKRLLLIFDQFEELFTQALELEQAAFIAAITALRQVPNCVLILTMRADFFEDLMTSDLWPVNPSQRLEIAPLRGTALRDAIAKPAERLGVYLEEGLLQRLLADAADEPGVLPLIQETMSLLWAQMERRLLPLSTYEQLGDDGRSGLAVAIANKADATLNTLSHEQRMIAHRIFLRLVQFGEGRTDTRRQQPASALRALSDDPPLFEQTLRHLTDNRLLTLSGTEDIPDKKVDIAHEVLISSWPTLRGWLIERREAEQVRRRLEANAAEWVRLGCESGGLLDDVELREAERWIVGPDAANLGYDEHLSALVRASRASIEQAKQELEAARERELAQAQALASEQQRRATTLRRSLAAVLVLVALLIVAGGVAVYLQQIAQQRANDLATAVAIQSTAEANAQQARATAEQQARLAESEAFAGESLSEFDVHNLDRALLLARAAILPDTHTYSPLVSRALARVVDGTVPNFRLAGLTSRVDALAWSPDGREILTGGYDGTVSIWNASTGALIRTLVGHTQQVIAVAWRSDGQQVLSGSGDTTARIWDVTTGKEIIQMKGNQRGVSAVAWRPDGQQVVTGGLDGTVRIWDARTGAELRPLEWDQSEVTTVMWSPDGQQVRAGGRTGTARAWNAATGEVAQTIHVDDGNAVWITAWSPGGRQILTGREDKTARIWDAATGQLLQTLPERTGEGHTGAVWTVAWSPDGHRVLTGAFDTTARIWDVATGGLMQVLEGHLQALRAVAWSADGQQVLTGGDDGVRVWDVPNQPVRLLIGHTGGVKAVAWSPDGQRILTGSDDQTARIWDAKTGTTLVTLTDRSITNQMVAVAWSPDGQQMLTGSDSPPATIWDATTGRVLHQLEGHAGGVPAVAWSPDGRQVLTGGYDGTVRIWDTTSGRQLQRLTVHPITPLPTNQENWINTVAWSSDGKQFLTGSADGTARIWDAATGTEVRQLVGHTNGVSAVAWSPNGQQILTGSADGTARIWNAATGVLLQELRGHAGYVFAVAWSPDGQQVLTGSFDATARIWDVATGRPVQELLGHPIGVLAVAWSPDGQQVLTGSWDWTARIWVVNPKLLVAKLTRDVCTRFTDTEVRTEIPAWPGCTAELAAVADDLKEYDALRSKN